MLLKEKTAVITGCRKGIGHAILHIFAENGANVFACVRTHSDEFVEECHRIQEQYHVSIWPLCFDFLDERQIKDAVKQISTTKNPIDVLVNNAGVAHGGLFQMTTATDIKKVFETNFFSQLSFTQRIAKIMIRQKRGSIVNIGSVAGIDGRSGTIAYGTSKSALLLATKTMANELAPFGIRVNAVAPGLIDTDMLTQMEEKARMELTRSNAMKRCGRSEEVANAVMFLASDLSSYITGQIIRVDGGMR